MPHRSFRDPSAPGLTISSAGDVLSARQAACDLVRGRGSPSPDTALARLVLTAVCLHLDAQHAQEAGPRDVARCLRRWTASDGADPGLIRSPMQFVRYAAMELKAMATGDRTRLFQQLLALVEPDGAGYEIV